MKNHVCKFAFFSKASKTQNEVQALWNEVLIQRNLSTHPNVVPMIKAFMTETLIVVVTQYQPAGDLRKVTVF